MPSNPIRYALLIALFLQFTQCRNTAPPVPVFSVLPDDYVYTIVQHNDSLYYSTPSGQIFRFHRNSPGKREQLGLKRFMPIRSLVFKPDGVLYAASYQTGVHRVKIDTLIVQPKLNRRAWSMKKDSAGSLWLAGSHGVFREDNDTLISFSSIKDANDIAFYRGKIAVAHFRGVSLIDPLTQGVDTTLCGGTICWLADSYGSLLVCGGVETCVIYSNGIATTVTIPEKNNIPWRSARISDGTIFLASQKGLLRIRPGNSRAECIAFRDSCIKTVYVDPDNHLWVGKYFKSTGSN